MRLVVSALLLAAATPAVAAPAGDNANRKETQRADLSGAPGMEVINSITTYHKGDRVPSHFHNGLESALVVQGTMIQRDGKPPEMMETGRTLLNLRDQRHGGYTVVGDTLVLFSVHVVDKGKPLYDGIR